MLYASPKSVYTHEGLKKKKLKFIKIYISHNLNNLNLILHNYTLYVCNHILKSKNIRILVIASFF